MTDKGFFLSQSNRKKYIAWLAKKVSVDRLSDLMVEHFTSNNGSGLLRMYNNSIQAVLDSLLVNNDENKVDRKHRPPNYWVAPNSLDPGKNFL